MTARAKVSTLVVDDEPAARAGLRHLLGEVDWIDCIGEAADGLSAIEAINTLRPELVFLDVQMPGMSGIELMQHLRHRPFVVFTTAYAQHAVTAFELGAIDYLLKPFGEQRLHSTLERVRAATGEPRGGSLDRFCDVMRRTPMSRLFVRVGRSIVPLSVDDIAWIEAAGDYIAAHTGGTPHLLHLSLNSIGERLDPNRFVRIHRAHIVNLDHVVGFRRETSGQLVAELKGGRTLQVSRERARDLRGLALG